MKTLQIISVVFGDKGPVTHAVDGATIIVRSEPDAWEGLFRINDDPTGKHHLSVPPHFVLNFEDGTVGRARMKAIVKIKGAAMIDYITFHGLTPIGAVADLPAPPSILPQNIRQEVIDTAKRLADQKNRGVPVTPDGR